MLFDEVFLAELSEKPVEGVLAICAKVRAAIVHNSNGWNEREYEVLLEALALVSSLVELNIVTSPYAVPQLVGNLAEDCREISEYLDSLEEDYATKTSRLKIQNFKKHFIVILGNGFKYEFSQGDLDRIQALVNELREHVSKSNDFEESHKSRLLSRLEKLQAELHKKMSDLDKFWGLIGDAGVVIGKFGDDVKPIVDRIKEITEIVWRTQARAEELPSDSPLPRLENKPSETDI